MANTNSQSVAIKLPPSFRNKTLSITAGIVLFFIIYLTILIAFLGLFIFSVQFTSLLISEALNILTGLIFIGANGFLLMILFFLAKIFIPTNKKDTEKTLELEVTPEQQPELFKAIYEVADAVKTIRPRKVYLIPDVNASVFHEKTLFSLFNSSHQNLNIGLGLVNLMSETELKSVLAHEFGHFSQNITRLSGFIYRVNRLIVDLLYNDTEWEDTIRKSSEWHGVLAIFGTITLWTAGTLRWIFQKIYELINLQFLSLSRDLEFHADTVAINVTGIDAMKHALWKLDLGEATFNNATSYLDKYLAQDLRCKNIFTVHEWLIRYSAERNSLPVKNGMPIVPEEFMGQIIKSRINYKDQWASHPSLVERIENIDKTGVTRDYSDKPAWTLFVDKTQLQEKLTLLMYQGSGKDLTNVKEIDDNETIKRIKDAQGELDIDNRYNSFYFNRTIEIDVENLVNELSNFKNNYSFDSFYTKENCNRIERLKQDITDRQIIEAIANKQLKVIAFEFDNKKYKRKNCKGLIAQLNAEIEREEYWLKELDNNAFLFNLKNASKHGELNVQHYIELIKTYISNAKLTNILNDYINYLNVQLANFSVIVKDDDGLKWYLRDIRNNETRLKSELGRLCTQNMVDFIDNEELKSTLKNYINDSSRFFLSQFSIDSEQITKKFDFLVSVNQEAYSISLKTLKKLTDKQLEWLN